jgi:hypothetical protein
MIRPSMSARDEVPSIETSSKPSLTSEKSETSENDKQELIDKLKSRRSNYGTPPGLDELMAKRRASGKSSNVTSSPLANSRRPSGASPLPNSGGSRIGQSPMPDRGRAHTVGNPLSDIALPTNSPLKEASVNPFDDVVPGTNFPERERQHANSYGGIALSRAQTSLPSTIRRVYKLKILLSDILLVSCIVFSIKFSFSMSFCKIKTGRVQRW